MPSGQLQRCPCCNNANLTPRSRPGRVVRCRNTALTLPSDLRLPSCRRCKYETLSAATLPSGLRESLYRSNLRERAILASARLRRHGSMRKLERQLDLSQGYLCRLSAGNGLPGAPLVSLLALLATYSDLVDYIEADWTLPPTD